jgi:hypothetical protein
MEKEFLTYNLSLRMKQLGFDEPCFGEWQNLKIGKNLVVDEEDRIYDVSVLSADIKAPLYQQAFRWFREKYGYLHHITYFDPVKAQIPGKADYQGLVLFPHQDVYKLAKISYDTYEEAELACLEKLIEIAELK